jgi:hypothetical protein
VHQNEEKIKTLTDKQKLRELINTRLHLQQMLKGVLQVEMKRHKAWQVVECLPCKCEANPSMTKRKNKKEEGHKTGAQSHMKKNKYL